MFKKQKNAVHSIQSHTTPHAPPDTRLTTRVTQCIRGVQIPPFYRLVSHYTDTHSYVFSLPLALPVIIKRRRKKNCVLTLTLTERLSLQEHILTLTLVNISSINHVSIFRCSSSPINPVYSRRVDSSALVLVFHHTDCGPTLIYRSCLYLSFYRFKIIKMSSPVNPKQPSV